MKKFTIAILALTLCLEPTAVYAGGGDEDGHGHEESGHDEHGNDEHGHDKHGHGDHGHGEHEDEPPKGPHGGRLLTSGDLSLELTIFEQGVPPQFRLYPYQLSKPLDPKSVSTAIKLSRFGGQVDEFSFNAESDYLTSEKVVQEPHSFIVAVQAEYAGAKHSWEFESFEGRTELSSRAIRAGNVAIETAGPQKISQSATVYGQLLANEDRVIHIHPRFPGVVRRINKTLGDAVRAGDVLAVIESNQSLKEYEIRSQLNGVVVERHLTLGEYVSESQQLFVVADLSELWADFQIYRDDFSSAQVGRELVIDADDGLQTLTTKVSYVSPITDSVTQSKRVRAVIANADGRFRPGLFVSGTLKGVEVNAAVAVSREAAQTFRDWVVVFGAEGDQGGKQIFQALPVVFGARDLKYVEVLSGVSAGQRYAAKNSYIIKADVEKSGASHDH